jgi:hypothetical protein
MNTAKSVKTRLTAEAVNRSCRSWAQSGESSWAVTYLDLSEARKTTVSAISSGCVTSMGSSHVRSHVRRLRTRAFLERLGESLLAVPAAMLAESVTAAFVLNAIDKAYPTHRIPVDFTFTRRLPPCCPRSSRQLSRRPAWCSSCWSCRAAGQRGVLAPGAAGGFGTELRKGMRLDQGWRHRATSATTAEPRSSSPSPPRPCANRGTSGRPGTITP